MLSTLLEIGPQNRHSQDATNKHSRCPVAARFKGRVDHQKQHAETSYDVTTRKLRWHFHRRQHECAKTQQKKHLAGISPLAPKCFECNPCPNHTNCGKSTTNNESDPQPELVAECVNKQGFCRRVFIVPREIRQSESTKGGDYPYCYSLSAKPPRIEK